MPTSHQCSIATNDLSRAGFCDNGNAIQQLSALVWILVRKSFVPMYVIAQEGTRDYLAIPEGRGFVYAHANQLYNRVKTELKAKPNI